MIARLFILAFVAVGLAPGTWLRTPVIQGLDTPITLRVIDEPGAQPPPGWAVQGVWQYQGKGLLFGGYSALLALDGARLRAFSDRGGRFTFLQPDQPQGADPARMRRIADQVDPAYQLDLFDIESATRDPVTGQYWLGFEYTHVFQRYGKDDESQGVRNISAEVDWPGNAGAEAMVRLEDGRFLVIPENGKQALLYPDDPVTGTAPVLVDYHAPPGDFSVTDAAQLPDGRILLLLRRVTRTIPPFEARIALAQLPDKAAGNPVLAPEIALDLSAVVPRENYEGVALRKRSDGSLDVWVIADDNLSIMQRTLLVKLAFNPQIAAPGFEAPPAPSMRSARSAGSDARKARK